MFPGVCSRCSVRSAGFRRGDPGSGWCCPRREDRRSRRTRARHRRRPVRCTRPTESHTRRALRLRPTRLEFSSASSCPRSFPSPPSIELPHRWIVCFGPRDRPRDEHSCADRRIACGSSRELRHTWPARPGIIGCPGSCSSDVAGESTREDETSTNLTHTAREQADDLPTRREVTRTGRRRASRARGSSTDRCRIREKPHSRARRSARGLRSNHHDRVRERGGTSAQLPTPATPPYDALFVLKESRCPNHPS